MRIEIINTGSELMLGNTLNTHQQWLCREFTQLGWAVSRQVAISDTGEDIQDAVREAITRHTDLIIVTGGLGPTSDDRTRDMIAQLFGKSLHQDRAILARIEEFFGKRNRPMPASTQVQALVPEGAKVLPNDFGTAPGLILEHASGAVLVMLPGPPRELRPMFTQQAVPFLKDRFPAEERFSCVILKTTGIGESFLEERIQEPLSPILQAGLEIGYCARVGDVDLRLVARGSKALELIDQAEALIQPLLGEFIYAREPEELEHLIVRLLTERKETLAIAESCTGGTISNRITNVPGASAVLKAGVVTYSNDSKEHFLGVRHDILLTQGAVSEPVAAQMAEGARKATGADYAISVTGIAGPSGGTAEKPVGTVYIGITSEKGTLVKKHLNQYDRETFKFLTSQQALDMLRRRILKGP